MSFLTDLAKGFVRSAVNQVGRDGGKVISNRLYGDRHSTPIRNVSSQNGIYYDETTSTPISEEELRERIFETRDNFDLKLMAPYADDKIMRMEIHYNKVNAEET